MKTRLITKLVTSLAATGALLVPFCAQAQTAVPADKGVAKSVSKKKPHVSASRTEIKSTAKNVAAGIEAAEDALTPAELSIAERVYIGTLPCELGSAVTLTADAKRPGYFDVHGKNFKYRMFPVVTTTGAIRLEDHKAGAVWLQLANKSMLMNQKLGTRLADECVSPAQVAVAEAIRLNPPVSVLDVPKPVATAAVPTTLVSASPAPATPASAAQPIEPKK